MLKILTYGENSMYLRPTVILRLKNKSISKTVLRKNFSFSLIFCFFPAAFEKHGEFFTFDFFRLDSLSCQKKMLLMKMEAFLLPQTVITATNKNYNKKTHCSKINRYIHRSDWNIKY